MDFKGRRVTVIGLSESGFSAAKLLRKLGARVRISELREGGDVKEKLSRLEGVQSEIGAHTKHFVSDSDLVIASPGVPPGAGPFEWAKEKNIPVISELELGYMLCPAPIIAVTGTNGKSTTVSLTHEILKANGIRSFLLGNIGRPICEDVLDIPRESVVVLEASSFQLEKIKTFKPKIAVLLNLTRDHLDRYSDMEEYGRAKLRIFENQENSDHAILDHDDPGIRALANKTAANACYFSVKQKVRGSYLEGERLMIDLGNGAKPLCVTKDIVLGGLHNLKNVLAAALAVRLIEEKADIAKPVKRFTGLEHRFEFVAAKEGVTFIDDSKSTTVDSTMRALESFSEKSVILIAGGRDKASDYLPLASQSERLKHAILIGEASEKIEKALEGSGIPVTKLPALGGAVSFSAGIAEGGDTVLLSPMCSSFDMFRDYKERGRAFKQAVFDIFRTAGNKK